MQPIQTCSHSKQLLQGRLLSSLTAHGQSIGTTLWACPRPLVAVWQAQRGPASEKVSSHKLLPPSTLPPAALCAVASRGTLTYFHTADGLVRSITSPLRTLAARGLGYFCSRRFCKCLELCGAIWMLLRHLFWLLLGLILRKERTNGDSSCFSEG